MWMNSTISQSESEVSSVVRIPHREDLQRYLGEGEYPPFQSVAMFESNFIQVNEDWTLKWEGWTTRPGSPEYSNHVTNLQLSFSHPQNGNGAGRDINIMLVQQALRFNSCLNQRSAEASPWQF